MSDLTTMIDYLNKHNVALLINSNNLNTQDSNSKMMIQMLGIIAEFERDVIKKRITDNLIELAKDGRWMGGIPPTGFTVDRSKHRDTRVQVKALRTALEATRPYLEEYINFTSKNCDTEDYSDEEAYFFGRSGTLGTESVTTQTGMISVFLQAFCISQTNGLRKLRSKP